MTIVKRITEGVPVEKRGCMGLVAGTSVRTPAGARRIENLRPGDLIVTKDDGLCPVRVVFSRTVTAAEIAADPALAPIRLTPRAIAPMMPAKGLSVGGEHRLLIPGWRLEDQEDKALCLVPARELLGSHDAIYTERGVVRPPDARYLNHASEALGPTSASPSGVVWMAGAGSATIRTRCP